MPAALAATEPASQAPGRAASAARKKHAAVARMTILAWRCNV
jgi:hypothetical protein